MYDDRKEGKREGEREGRKGVMVEVMSVLQTHKLRLIGVISPFYWTIELSTGYPQAVKNPCEIYHNPYYDIVCNHSVTNTPGWVTDCNFCLHFVTGCSYPNTKPPNKPHTFPKLSIISSHLPHLSSYPSFPYLPYPLIPSSKLSKNLQNIHTLFTKCSYNSGIVYNGR